MIDRLPPQNIEAEQSVIGSMLIDKEAVTTVVEILKPADFYKESHQIIFSAIALLYEKSEPIDLITVSNELKRENNLDKIGSGEYLTQLIDCVPTSAYAENYARIVKEKSDLRSLIYAGNSIIQMGFQDSEKIEEIIDRAEQMIFSIAQKRNTRDFSSINSILPVTFQKISDRYENKSNLTGLSTGFKDIDQITAGLQAAELIVVAARPSMGKTAICLNIAAHIANHEKKSVGILSLEMSKDLLVQRMICSEAQIDAQRLRTGNLNENDWPRITKAIAQLSESKIFIDDSSDLSVMEIRSRARRLKSKYGLDILIIDYLQMIKGNSKNENRNQEISEISRQLKNLAKELNIPVISLSQLSRAVESRADKRPLLSDLRESGAIEQEADIVAFIYRDDYYNVHSERKNIAEFIISKQRNGDIGTIDLYFIKEFTKFVDLEKYRE